MCPLEWLLFIPFMYWQACPYSRQHCNKLPESFSFFCRQAAVASLCQGGQADPELAPAAFQELAHADAVAAILFCKKTVPSETSHAVKTKKNIHTSVKFWRATLSIQCLKQVGMRLEEAVG